MARYSNPRQPDSLPAIAFDNSGDSLTLSFYRAEDSTNLNLTLILEKSSNMVDWSLVDLQSASASSLGNNVEQVSLDITLSEALPDFYRLHVIRP